MSHDIRDRAGRSHDCQPGRAVQMRCLECGAESAEATEICARCGAPTSFQPSIADPAVAQRAGRSGPSRRLMITVGVAAALGVAVGIIAGLNHSGSSASSTPSTGQLTIYQLRAGDCLQDSGETLANFNDGNGPFTVAPCTRPHTDEVVFAGNSWPRALAYPGDQAVYDDGLARCIMAFSAYDGIDVDSSSSVFDVVSSTPDSSTWPNGDRWLVCFADAYTSVDYSVKGKHQ